MAEPSDSQVRYPEMRQRLHHAASNLCDERYQERLWARGERQTQDELGFDDTLLVVVDESERFGDDLVGDVLVDEDEHEAFTTLFDSTVRLVDRLSRQGGYADAVAMPEWPEVVRAAQALDQILRRS